MLISRPSSFFTSFDFPVRQKLNEADDIVKIKLIYEDGCTLFRIITALVKSS